MHVYMCDLEALCYLSISKHLSETAGGGGEMVKEVEKMERNQWESKSNI